MSEYDLNARVAEARERKRRDDAEAVRAIHDRVAAETWRARDAFERRDREDQEARAKDLERRQSQSSALQLAQATWARQRDELQAERDELRRLLTSARGAVISEPLADARIAAADVQIYEKRLDLAERALAAHAKAQPAGW